MEHDVTFGESAKETIIEDVFGWHISDSGTVVTGEGEPAPSVSDEPVTVEEFGGVVKTDDGPKIVRDNSTDIIQIV